MKLETEVMVKLQARRFGVSLAKFNVVCKKSVALKIDVVCSIGLHLLETLIFVAERLMRGKNLRIKKDFDRVSKSQFN